MTSMKTEVPDPRPPGPTAPDPEPPAPEPPQPPDPQPPVERGVQDNLEQRCGVCGVELTRLELAEAREAGPPFLCSVHAAEQLPVLPDEESRGPSDAAEAPS